MTAAAPTPRDIAAAWPTELLGLALYVVDSVDSTQRLARTLLDRLQADDEEPPPTLFVAVAQGSGRGRRGRSWESAPGRGLWATLLFSTSPEELGTLPLRAALALAETLRDELPAVRIKWPNDLVVDHRKLAGLLVDVVQRPPDWPWALLGFGVDLAHRKGELPGDFATSLWLELGGTAPSLPAWTARCAGALWPRLATAEAGWLARYRSLSAHAPGDRLECDLESERVTGRFAGFEENGCLMLDTAGGRRSISAGEVFAW
jgi:BirA family biotin operon repressor/biotin-[acetyl-CoA-carboxylase] ligase